VRFEKAPEGLFYIGEVRHLGRTGRDSGVRTILCGDYFRVH
jgi:hypothetical protein